MKRSLLIGVSSFLLTVLTCGASSSDGNTIKVRTSCGEETWLYVPKGTSTKQLMEYLKLIENDLCGEGNSRVS